MRPTSKIPTTIHDTNLLRSMSRRRGIQLKTSSRPFEASAEPIQNTASTRIGKLGTDHESKSRSLHGKPAEIPVEDPDKPSTDLRRKPRGLIRWVKYLPGRIKRFVTILRPPLTQDQLEAREFLRVERKRNKLAQQEGHKYGVQTSNKLAQLGMRELLNNPDPNKPRKLKLVKWSMISRDELFTKIVIRMNTNPKHLPAYVRVSELGRDPLYSDELLPTIGHFVKWNSDDYGVTLTIFRHGLDGLPERVVIDELWKRCPENKPPLTVAVGFGDNSSTHFINPDEYPHLLITGGTGWGKSNMINQLICFWLDRGITPNELQLVLFDLKKGMEFSSYEHLPHLYRDDTIKTGIVEELEGVLPTMRRMQEIRDQRMEHIKKAGYKSFQEYNLGVKMIDRMPAIFLVFDEWAKIRLSRSGMGPKALVKEVTVLANKTIMDIFKNRLHEDRTQLFDSLIEFGKGILKLRQSTHFGLEAEEMLAEFTNLARAAGMYVILSTQHPSREVLTGLIMINFPTRIVLNSSVGGSMAALGTQSAFKLEYKGRAILMDRGQEIKLQTPYISPNDIKAIVHKAITGKELKRTSGVDIEEILTYSLNNLDGMLDITKLFSIFKAKKVRFDWIKASMRDAEGQEFILSGTKYRISPRRYRTPRHLSRIDD
jgi:hypothetical protein